jgi:hypothetical protein
MLSIEKRFIFAQNFQMISLKHILPKPFGNSNSKTGKPLFSASIIYNQKKVL